MIRRRPAIVALRSALLDWYDANRRDLPWRRTRDPYGIWVSEIMLQQTTVRAVDPRWRRFMAKYPSVEALAAAPEDDVLAEWTGLGYYARARNLHRAARKVAADFGGLVPGRFEVLLALPGLGRYTAAAIASIAFGEAVAVVDANVERVVARLDRIGADPKSAPGRRAMVDAAEGLLDPARPGDWNQAMMELGATVCLPRAPQCPACPLRDHCGARADGEPERWPAKAPKPDMREVREVAVLLRKGGRVLVLRRPEKGSFANMWELPRGEVRPREASADAVVRIAKEVANLDVTARRPIMKLKHVVMRRNISLQVWEAERLPGGRIRAAQHAEHEWISVEEWSRRPSSVTQRKVAEFVSAGGGAGGGERFSGDAAGDEGDLFGG